MTSVESGSVVRPRSGCRVAGDTAFVNATDERVFAAIIDVLGHGEEAHALAVRMEDHLVTHASNSVVDMLSGLHEAFRGSRGAAVGLCLVDIKEARLRFAGVGNTVIRRFGRCESRLVSRDGVVGGTMGTPVEEVLELSDGDVILMYTDGVRTHFTSSDLPRLRTDPPYSVAAGLVHRFGKWHDDASCVVVRYRQ
jgi:serine phosphatase RsbU (regulator of sigma subunit)